MTMILHPFPNKFFCLYFCKKKKTVSTNHMTTHQVRSYFPPLVSHVPNQQRGGSGHMVSAFPKGRITNEGLGQGGRLERFVIKKSRRTYLR